MKPPRIRLILDFALMNPKRGFVNYISCKWRRYAYRRPTNRIINKL